MRKVTACCSVLLVIVASGVSAQPQNFPNKALRIVATEAGGGADLVARLVAQGLREPLGQPVIVENRGATLIAIDILTKAPPNGYTLFLGGVSVFMEVLARNENYNGYEKK